MDSFERRLVADLATIADTLPPLGPTARPRRTPPLSPLVATFAVLALALGAAYVARSDSPPSPQPVAPAPSTPADALTTQVANSLYRFAGLDGFGKPVADEDTGLVTLSWSGPVPDEVAAEAGVRPNGVRVQIIRSDYSMEELDAASEAILARYPIPDNPHLGSVGPDDQMSGLRVTVDPTWLAAHDVAQVTDEFADLAGVPVRVLPTDVEGMPAP